VISELGRGASGTVYLVREEGRARPVALKLLSEREFSEKALRHFEEEFKILAQLAHPNLTEVYDFGRARIEPAGGEVPFFTMEYVEGETFDRALGGGALDYAVLYECLAQLAQALAYLHGRGFVHSDVKPSNVLVARREAGSPIVKLMDLGLARRPAATGREGSIRGTAAYLSPEAARGGPVDPRSDLYSLGCLVYEVLTGGPPFRAASAAEVIRGHLLEDPLPPSSLRRGIPPALDSLVLRLLAKDPARRPVSADRFLELLGEVAGGTISVSTPETRRLRVLGSGFVGREAELGRLEAAAEQVRRGGAGRFVLIGGEAGVGKSRLLREFEIRCQLSGLDVFSARAETGASPRGALPEALARAIRQRGGLSEQTGRTHGAALSEFIGEGLRQEDLSGEAGSEGRARLVLAVSAAVEDLLRGGPFVLALDDLHLAGETVANLLGHLVRALSLASQEGRSLPLLLVGTYRTEEVFRSSPLAELLSESRQHDVFEEVLLAPFGRQQAASLVGAMLGLETVPDAWVDRIQERTGGNPLFIGELVALLAEEGQIRPGSPLPEEAEAIARVELPGRIRDLLSRRCERLSEEAREVLSAAAIVGGAQVDPDTIAALTGKRWDRVVRCLLDLSLGGFVLREEAEDGTPAYRLAHPSFARLVLERAPAEEVRRLHGRALAYLERRGVPRRPGAWAAVGRHAEEAGQPGRAIEAYRRAADLARGLEAMGEAIELYGRALRLALERGETASALAADLYGRRARAFALVGDVGRAEEDARSMLARAEESRSEPLRARAHLLLGTLLRSRGDSDTALEALELALEVARRIRDVETTSEALRELGRTLAEAGQPNEGLARLEEAAHVGRQAGRADLEIASLLVQGALLRDRGEYKLALQAIERAKGLAQGGVPQSVREALDDAEAHALEAEGRYAEAAEVLARARDRALERGDLPAAAELTLSLGAALGRCGESERARREFESALEQERRLGRPEGVLRCLESLALLDAVQGRFEAALDIAEDALRIARRLARKQFAGRALELVGAVHLRVGDVDRAAACLAEAHRLGPQGGGEPWQARLLLDQGDLAWLGGRVAEARRGYQEAAFLARKAGDRRLESQALARLGVASLRDNDPDRALVACRKALSLVDNRGLLREEAEARLLRARIELVRPGGDLIRAETEALEALRLGRQLREPEPIWEAEHLAAKAAGRMGRHEEAADRLERAHRYIEGVRSGLHPRRREAFLRDPRRAELYEEFERVQAERARAATRARPPSTAEAGARLQQEVSALRRLLEVQRAFASARDGEELLGAALDAAVQIAGAERGFFVVRDNGRLTARLSHSPLSSAPGQRPDRPSLDLARRALEAAEPILATAPEGASSPEAGDPPEGRGIRSLLAIPLRVGEEVAGALLLENPLERGGFPSEAIEWVGRLAEQAGTFLAALRTLAESERRRQELERLNERLQRALEAERSTLATVREELVTSRSSFELRFRFEELVGGSPSMQRLYHLIERLAPKRIPVLIVGESGTGKELIARALHRKSDRSGGPFLTVNCAALPEPLLESELFGYRRGAFTGAERDKPGYFELAHGGTLFLDEIGEMGPAMQAKLLRAVQDGEILPVGGKSPLRVDVRIVSATHRDLASLVREGKFREDLYYRIHVARIEVPPLRERREDIPLLVQHFLAALAEEEKRPPKTIEPEALRCLVEYDWPGNVRELQHAILRVSAFARGPAITLRDLRSYGELAPGATSKTERLPAEVDTLEELERKQILLALQKAGGNKTRAAELLGINRATLFRKLRRFGLSA